MGFLDSFSTRNRLRTLEEAFETLERKVKGLETEWNETLDKFNRLHGRIAKRAQLDSRRVSNGEGPSPDLGPDTGDGLLTTAERHRRLNAEIAARRHSQIFSKDVRSFLSITSCLDPHIQQDVRHAQRSRTALMAPSFISPITMSHCVRCRALRSRNYRSIGGEWDGNSRGLLRLKATSTPTSMWLIQKSNGNREPWSTTSA